MTNSSCSEESITFSSFVISVYSYVGTETNPQKGRKEEGKKKQEKAHLLNNASFCDGNSLLTASSV